MNQNLKTKPPAKAHTKLTGRERVKILRLRDQGHTMQAISNLTGRSELTVSRVIGGDPRGRGSKNRRPVKHIIELRKAGWSYRAIIRSGRSPEPSKMRMEAR
jgi:hypothetical protein